MKKSIKYLLVFVLVVVSFITVAQHNTQTASQLAFKYYNAKEYRPASSLFYNLYKATKSKTYFKYYIECLLQVEDYNDAESFTKKQIRKRVKDKSFLITLGYIYKKTQQLKAANEQFDKVLQKLEPSSNDIISVANEFLSKREFAYAEKTFFKGRKLLKNPKAFQTDLANIYQYQRDYYKMITEYLNALSVNPKKLSLVQNRIQSAFVMDIDNSLEKVLKQQLIQKLLDEPKNFAFKELMQWFYMQKKQFSDALVQAKSLDLLKHENGVRLINLAGLARSNNDFVTAIKSLQLVVDKGADSPNYLAAQKELLYTKYLQLENLKDTSKRQWQELVIAYDKFLLESENKALFYDLVVVLAHIESWYLNKADDAIADLENLLKDRRLNRVAISKVKMKLADIKLFANEKWDAILLYSQIDKANKNNPLGYEAKFKKAKVSYYLGEVKWANAQLSAIKGSTSKLIANDAILLSQLITDNTGLDTTYAPIQKFARADFMFYQNKPKQAIATLDSLLQEFPANELTDDVYLLKYKIYKQQHNPQQAQAYLDKIIAEYPQNTLAAQALYFKALLLLDAKKSEAELLLKKILTDYADSVYAVDARKKLKDIKR